MSVSVLLADDQELVRTGLRTILQSQEDIEVVGEAEDGGLAVEAAAAAPRRGGNGRADADHGRARGHEADR